MPVTLNGQTYYRTSEVCQIVSISKSTLFCWLKQGIFSEAEHRDRRGWRLFTEDEIHRLKAEANRININKIQAGKLKEV
jgi:DNA-binding transcriptional MerR regulator